VRASPCRRLSVWDFGNVWLGREDTQLRFEAVETPGILGVADAGYS